MPSSTAVNVWKTRFSAAIVNSTVWPLLNLYSEGSKAYLPLLTGSCMVTTTPVTPPDSDPELVAGDAVGATDDGPEHPVTTTAPITASSRRALTERTAQVPRLESASIANATGRVCAMDIQGS